MMRLALYQSGRTSSRFTLANGTEVHIYGPEDNHDFFGTGPVVGFLVDDGEGARAETEGAGVTCIGDGQRSATHIWNHFRAPGSDVYVYELMAEVPDGPA